MNSLTDGVSRIGPHPATRTEAEARAEQVRQKHNLSSLHIFDRDGGWTVFGFRKEAKGFQASVESGHGQSISDAIKDLDARLVEGPIHKSAEALP